MSQDIPDANHDYLTERCEIRARQWPLCEGGALNPRILTQEQQQADTEDIATQPQAIERETRICIAACMITAGALVLVLCDVP